MISRTWKGVFVVSISIALGVAGGSGNAGRARVSSFQVMPLSQELETLLNED